MDYNTQKKKLKLPEYGRNIQTMVDYLLTIEDKEKRTEQAYAVIDVMGNLNPQLRDIPDFRHKLWDHLAIISDFKLDIEAPYELPKEENFLSKPQPIPYSQGNIKARFYGKTVEKLIEKIKDIPEESKKPLIIQTANYMKKSFLTWNKESVEDEQIINDINRLYGEELLSSSNVELSEQTELMFKKSKPNFAKNQNGKNSHKSRNFKRKNN